MTHKVYSALHHFCVRKCRLAGSQFYHKPVPVINPCSYPSEKDSWSSSSLPSSCAHSKIIVLVTRFLLPRYDIIRLTSISSSSSEVSFRPPPCNRKLAGLWLNIKSVVLNHWRILFLSTENHLEASWMLCSLAQVQIVNFSSIVYSLFGIPFSL
jgi:hypothetical protein